MEWLQSHLGHLGPSGCPVPWALSGLDVGFPDTSDVRMTRCDCIEASLKDCFFRRRCTVLAGVPWGHLSPSFTEEPEALAVTPQAPVPDPAQPACSPSLSSCTFMVLLHLPSCLTTWPQLRPEPEGEGAEKGGAPAS